MTRNDVLLDQRIRRYSEGKATEGELAELRALAETEPLYREALETFRPWTDEESAAVLEAARALVRS